MQSKELAKPLTPTTQAAVGSAFIGVEAEAMDHGRLPATLVRARAVTGMPLPKHLAIAAEESTIPNLRNAQVECGFERRGREGDAVVPPRQTRED